MRSVVVTGASTGIGKACALRLDREGWRVFATVRKASDAATLRAEGSAHLTPLLMDVTDAASIAAMATLVREAVGDAGLQGLVNNAGMATGGLLEVVDLNELRRVMEVNVVGQLAVTQPLIPLLRRGRGRVVMMSSISGRSALPLVGLYSASKHALEAITDALRLELHPWDIHVVSIQPGTIATPIWEKTLAFAEGVMPSYPEATKRLYGPLIDAMLHRLRHVKGASVDSVADAVAHALTAARPRTRYVVGRDARLGIWLTRLPDRWRDRLILQALPRYGRAES
jgi:NAD(P)-dependent dehydrogenase (short-subunit alcohol dehydrogenase family)